MRRRLVVATALLAIAVAAFLLARDPTPVGPRPATPEPAAAANEVSDAPRAPFDPESVPAPTVPPTEDDVDRLQRLLAGNPDAGIPMATGIGLEAALAAGVPRERVRAALDVAAQRVIAAALADCASEVGTTSPVAVSAEGEREFIESISSTGTGEFVACARSLFGAYLPHDPARREFVVPPP